MKRSQFLTIMAVLLVPGLLVLLAPRAWADSSGVPAEVPSDTAEAPVPALTGACTVTKIKFSTGENTTLPTTSTTFVAMPNMSVAFTMGGLVPSCVKVEFSAYVFASTSALAPSGELMFVRARLDGVTVGSPSEVQLDGDSDEDGDGKWARSHAFNFAFTNVTPGLHTITIQWRSLSGGTVFVHRRSMFVHYR